MKSTSTTLATISTIITVSTCFLELPIDLIFDILSRLSIRTLIQLKSVCKTWYKIIENPNFIKMYHTRNPIIPGPLTCVLVTDSHQESRTYTFRLQCLDKTNITRPNPNFLFYTYPDIVGICDGLVCAVLNDSDQCVICNPTTCRVRKTKIFTLQKVKPGSGLVFFGFGYHDNEYKLFRFVYSGSHKGISVRAEMYSMSNNIWGEIEVVVDAHERLSSCVSFNPPPVVVNEVLYWRGYSRSHVPCVVYFDMNGYVFGVIACPQESVDMCRIQWQLVDFKGELALITGRHSASLELWVLDEKEKSWVMKTRNENIPHLGRGLKCLGCDINGDLVLQYYTSQWELKLYLQDLEMRNCTYLAFVWPEEKQYDVYLYTESLLAV